MDWIIHTFWLNRSFNDSFTILFFWLPMLFNLIAYAIRVHTRIQSDKVAYAAGDTKHHHDYLRFGHLVGYLAVSVIPVLNIFWFVFDTLGDLWRILWKRFAGLFNFRFVGSDDVKPKPKY